MGEFPRHWSLSPDENIAWQVELSGYGQSSPVVFGGSVFVTSVEGDHKETGVVRCFDAQSGEAKWEQRITASIEIESSEMISRGAPTACGDDVGADSRLYVFFESGDLAALNPVDGEFVWQRSLSEESGEIAKNHGLGSSLVRTSTGLVLVVDRNGASFVRSFDPETGENQWTVEREPRVAWATPLVARFDEAEELVVSSNGSVVGLDPTDGAELWSVDGIVGNTIPSPCPIGEDTVLVPASSKGESFALRRTADGVERAWTAEAPPLSFASPIVVGDHALLVNKAGVAFCIRTADGSQAWRQRLGESCWATPIVTDAGVYFFGKSGKTTLLRIADDAAEIVTESELPTEGTVYGVAAAGGTFYVREGGRLTAIRHE